MGGRPLTASSRLKLSRGPDPLTVTSLLAPATQAAGPHSGRVNSRRAEQAGRSILTRWGGRLGWYC